MTSEGMVQPMSQIYLDSLAVGDALIEQHHVPTQVQLFRYSAITWNSHRIHWDLPYAQLEGYPGLLVQSHLHQAFLTRLCTDWMGPTGRLVRLDTTVRRFALPGQKLTCRGVVTQVEPIDDRVGNVTATIEEVREADEVVCARAEAIIQLPRSASPVAV
jgi:hydroxyacyl-ACP dehydratase HTD2-like protein with hotdog domain